MPYLECLFVELTQTGTHRTLIGCVYRPPNTDLPSFNLAFLDVLKSIDCKGYKSIAIAGDFNLDLVKSDTHNPTGEFLQNLLSYSYLPAINIPTRITELSKTVIDNVFISNANPITNAAVVYCDISDHLPIAVCTNTKLINRPKNVPIARRDFTTEAVNNFNTDLANPLVWTDVYNCVDPNTSYSKFHDTYLMYFNKHFPIKKAKVRHKHSPRHEWMTKGLINASNKKANLYKKYIKTGKSADKAIYIRYLNALKKTDKNS